jgi:hydroxymethylglutaryl-CoA synthase
MPPSTPSESLHRHHRADNTNPANAVGIDALSAYVPRAYVDLTGEWAYRRLAVSGASNIDNLVGKIRSGIGVERMAIPDAHEDIATMAAMAVKQLIETSGINPEDIAYLAIGTESTVDQSKSVAAYVLGMIERYFQVDLSHVGCPQYQFACAGATYALESALAGLKADVFDRPYAVVVASDIAHYSLESPGEYTQGAGAVAMLLSRNPRLMVLEPSLIATVTRDERDFFRPNYSKTAVVDGKYSVGVYLDCISAALDQFLTKKSVIKTLGTERPVTPQALYDAIDHLVFHVPFPKMADYAMARLATKLWPGHADFPEISKLLATLSDQASSEERAALERSIAKHPEFRRDFNAKIAPSLKLTREVGNIYTGSLYLALASLIEDANQNRRNLAGDQILLLSYGSGATAKILMGQFAATYRDIYSDTPITDWLSRDAVSGRRERFALSCDSYEQIHTASELKYDTPAATGSTERQGASAAPLRPAAIQPHVEVPDATGQLHLTTSAPSVRRPNGEFALVKVGAEDSGDRVDIGYRYYEWIPEQFDTLS